jgi:hypothetical protein
MNIFFCKLTGGHKYKDVTLETKLFPNGLVGFRNVCQKCGHISEWMVPEKNLYPEKYREIISGIYKDEGKNDH